MVRTQSGQGSIQREPDWAFTCVAQALLMTKTPLGLVAGCELLLLIYSFGLALAQSPRPSGAKTPEYTFKVIHVFPHDSAAFTQGLVYHDGFLYESTGLNGRSSLRRVRL